LWTKVHDILGRCRRPLVVVKALDRLSILHFVPKTGAIKVAIKLQSRPKKVVFGPQICRGRGYPRFWTHVFKSQLLPSKWPILVEFRSASSENRRRKKKEEKEEESVIKYKSADILCRAA